MKIRFLTPAERELDEAFEYYESHLGGLGYKFIAEIDAALTRIAKYPLAWHPMSLRTRRCRLKRFPYGLIYQVRARDEILIVAVSHLHRSPLYWRDRIR